MCLYPDELIVTDYRLNMPELPLDIYSAPAILDDPSNIIDGVFLQKLH
jgi:hypothetical protein